MKLGRLLALFAKDGTTILELAITGVRVMDGSQRVARVAAEFITVVVGGAVAATQAPREARKAEPGLGLAEVGRFVQINEVVLVARVGQYLGKMLVGASDVVCSRLLVVIDWMVLGGQRYIESPDGELVGGRSV